MAHCMKLTRAGCGHMFKHYERAKDENGEYIKFGNQDIDAERTHLNYNLAPSRNISQGEFVKQRCSEVYCLNRRDVNVMCSWVVTLPKEVKGKDDTEYFFKKAYEFLEKRYGKENVVSAFVHMDEKTPHMHFAFVPVVYDEKKKRYKVSAKECISKNELCKFHEDLQNYFDTTYLSCKILNEATKEGNKSIKELKRGTATLEVEKAKLELSDVKSELDKTKAELQEQLNRVEEVKKLRGSVIDRVTEHKSLTGKVKKVTMPIETYNACLSAQHRADGAEMQLRWVKNDLDKLRASTSVQRVKELTLERDNLLKENIRLKSIVKTQNEDIEKVNKILKAFPDIQSLFSKAYMKLFAPSKSKTKLPDLER